MAGIQVTASTDEQALAAATEKLMLHVEDGNNNQRMKLLRWGVFFDSTTSNSEPVIVNLKLSSVAITNLTSQTSYKITPGPETPVVNFSISNGASNIAVGDVVDSIEVHPQSGYEMIYPMGQEIIIPGGFELFITANAPGIVNCKAKMTVEV